MVNDDSKQRDGEIGNRETKRKREREIDYAVGLPCLTRKNRLASGEERDGKEEGERHLAVGL